MSEPRDTQLVVLMGGLGSRLGFVGEGVPKPMVEVAGRPFFEYMLDLLKWHGFRRFLFLVGHHGNAIEEYFGDGAGQGIEIRYSYDGDQLVGTGGALRRAIDQLDDEFVLIYGDSYMDADYGELLCHFRYEADARGKQGLMAIFRNQGRYDKSNALLRDGELLEYNKSITREDMEHIDYGISVLRRSLLESLPEGEPSDLADVYRDAVEGGTMAGLEVHQRFYEIGTLASLREFERYIERRSGGQAAVFLDRDGTLNEIVYNDDIEQLDSPLSVEQLRLLPGVIEGLKRLQSLGFLLLVVTNQPAAAKGKVSLRDLYRINSRLRHLLREEGIELSEVLMCPHHPVGVPERCREDGLICECDCRKPGSLLLRRAIEKYNINVEHSYFVGDSFVDVLAARSENLKSVFLGNFKCDVCERLHGVPPDLLFSNVADFSDSLEGRA